MAIPAGIPQIFKSNSEDIAYQILLSLGWNMATPVPGLFKSVMDDILYQILLKLTGGGGGGGGSTVVWNRLEIRPTDPPLSHYELPAKCFISHAIVKSDVVKTFSLEANNSVVGEEVELFPSRTFDYHIPIIETFSPVIYVPTASKITQSWLYPTDLWADIFYTTTTI